MKRVFPQALVLAPLLCGLTATGCQQNLPEVRAQASPQAGPILTTNVPPPVTPGGRGSIAPNKLTGEAALERLRAERDRYFLNAQQEDYRSVRVLLAQHQDELERGLNVSKIIHGSTQRKEIALTFDDGPHPKYTPQLLAILKQYKIPATFFVVGMEAEKYPDLVRAEIAGGHAVGNHTYHHVSLPKIPQEYVADEIKACGDVLKAITGKAPYLFRPPGGEYDTQVAEASEALGYKMVLWTDDPGDYASPGEQIILKRTVDKARNGGILLLHDGIDQTIKILPRLIETLRTQGYTFITMDQMVKEQARSKTALPPAQPRPAKQGS